MADIILNRKEKRVAIKTLLGERNSLREIASKLQVSKTTVQKWAHSNTLDDKPKSGRPRKLSPTSKSQIKRNLFEKTGTSVRKVTKKQNESKRYRDRGKTISRSSVQRYVKKQPWGKTAYKHPHKPLRSQKNIEDRVKFGEKLKMEGFLDHSRLFIEKRSSVLYTDES